MRFRLFGFPVTFGGDALVISLLLLAWAYERTRDLGPVLLFAAAVVPVVVVHELGHAFEARRAGGSPAIRLGILGGSTSGIPGGISPWRSLWIAAAGIVYSLIFIAVVWISRDLASVDPTTLLGRWLGLLITVNAFWAVIQLLPIGRFDGAAILEHLLAGLGVPRPERILLVVIVAVGVPLVWFGFRIGQPYLALYGGYLTWTGARDRLERMNSSADRDQDWRSEMDRLVARGDHREIADRAAEIQASARSAAYRRWALGYRVAALDTLGAHGELAAVLHEHERLLDPLRAAGLWLRCDGPDRALNVLGSWLRTATPDTLAGKPWAKGTLLETLIRTKDRGPLWDSAKQVDYADIPVTALLGIRRLAYVHRADHVLDLLAPVDGTPDPEIGPADAASAVLLANRNGPAGPLVSVFSRTESPGESQKAALGLVMAGRGAALADAVRSNGVAPHAAAAAQLALHLADRYQDAVDAGLMALRSSDEPMARQVSYNLACSLARMGRTREALDRLAEADSGMVARARSDDDLASLRDDPRFSQITGM